MVRSHSGLDVSDESATQVHVLIKEDNNIAFRLSRSSIATSAVSVVRLKRENPSIRHPFCHFIKGSIAGRIVHNNDFLRWSAKLR
jgi:hypothetical protein